jgi:adenosylcobinamide-phosphate synthase
MGNYIKWFEKNHYQDSVQRGLLLTLTLLLLTFMVIHAVTLYIGYMGNIYIQTLLFAIIGSTTIASTMLYESVKDIIEHPEHIRYLVSRDTQELTHSEINKAAIESYAENLSDGVIAPLFYLFLFGIDGAFLYKAINTLDSMVGYHNERYEKFGKVSAKLDDLVNYLPARLTAYLIALLMKSREAFRKFKQYGERHESPNAGHPIASMALAIGVKLGGDTSYFGKLKKKAYFGDGKDTITKEEIIHALSFRWRFDIFITILLGVILYVQTASWW